MGSARKVPDYANMDDATFAASTVDAQEARLGGKLWPSQRERNEAAYAAEADRRVTRAVNARTAELYKTRGAVPAVATAVTSSGESTDAPVVDREGEVELGSGYSGTPSSRRRGRFRSGSGSISI